MAEIGAPTEIILFVDDEVNILASLRRALHGWAQRNGVGLETAGSAPEALALLEARSHEVAVIVSDLRMPEMLGSDFLLKVKDLYPWILTILLTGYSEVGELMRAIKAGIYGYLMKPWKTDYLIAELDKCLGAQRLRAEAAAKTAALEEELRWAGEMQRVLLKPRLEASPGIEFDNCYNPVEGLYCGGDYYDIIDLGENRYFFLLGDVAGHGVKAAFITGILKAVIFPEYVRRLEGRRFKPGAFLGWLNTRMNYELRGASGLLITFLAAVIDLEAATVAYANAGHCRPILLSKGGLRELEATGPVIGCEEGVEYMTVEEPFLPGEVLFAYTDGLTELGASGGAEGLLDVPALLGALPPGPDLPRRVLEAAIGTSRAPAFDDDVTILMARRL